MIGSVKQMGNRRKKNERSLRDLWDTNKHVDIRILGGERGGQKKLFKEITKE